MRSGELLREIDLAEVEAIRAGEEWRLAEMPVVITSGRGTSRAK